MHHKSHHKWEPFEIIIVCKIAWNIDSYEKSNRVMKCIHILCELSHINLKKSQNETVRKHTCFFWKSAILIFIMKKQAPTIDQNGANTDV